MNNENVTQKTSFFCLPFEIRLQIYELIFGLEDIHIIKRFSRPNFRTYSYRCREGTNVQRRGRLCQCIARPDFGYEIRYPSPFSSSREMRKVPNPDPDPPVPGLGIAGLLLTSKAFHVDVLATLHEHRTFEFNDFQALILFSTSASPAAFASIRSVFLDTRPLQSDIGDTDWIECFPLPYQERFDSLNEKHLAEKICRTSSIPLWVAACKTLSLITPLQNLIIVLSFNVFGSRLVTEFPDKFISSERLVFEPLNDFGGSFKALQNFEVHVDWASGDEKWDEREKRFQLVRHVLV
ncbi:hypothetical protein P154DRAFT_571854 [Amniculicola lignicola CBS 123094]|uniref:DUF7730 domain-containing protein n=1 Tax=Amniculicola lignicola CBS 123094 TaxID=1392246 RepID=A0A6A5WV77_9PLEO|nr:hypothetical protein P154DRAFT_571854 [Amniculicola lignicola CBS 123094]